MKPSFFLLGSLIFGLAGTAQGINLITNGSFEDPTIPNGTYQIGGITGWYSTMGDGGEIQRNAAGTAYDGIQLLELDGNQNSNLLQDVPTTPMAVYSLNFQYSPRPGVGLLSNPVEIYFGGSLLDTLSGVGGNDTVWTFENYMVLGGPGATTTLEFRGVGTSDSLGGYIDDVKLEPRTPGQVPEGGAGWVALLGSLTALAGVRRRLNR